MQSVRHDMIGGVVLCGGLSTRMGRPKAWLPFGTETMLTRVVRILDEVVSRIVVVASRDQELPNLPGDVIIARDEFDAFGPLAGIAVGLSALTEQCNAAYVTSCDAPLLTPNFVRAMIGRLGGFDMVVPREDDASHPLAAVYRTRLGAIAQQLILSGQRRLLALLDVGQTLRIDANELRHADPNLRSLWNVNTPADYEVALREAGWSNDRTVGTG